MKQVSLSKYFIVAAVLVSLSFSPGFAAKKKRLDQIKFPELNTFDLPEIKKTQTGNGIKLRLIKDEKLPLVDLKILIRGGDAYDPTAKAGLAVVTAQLLRIGGTRDLQPDQLDQSIDANGISINIGSNIDFFTISLSCLQENFSEAVSILSQMLLYPAFDKEKLEEIKTQFNSAISRRNDDPGSINNREFNTLIYGKDSPFAAVIEYKHIDNITMADIVGFYKRFFAPDNMLTGIVSPLEMAEVKEVFEKHFGSWTNTTRIPPYPVVKQQMHDFKVGFAEKSNLNQSYLSIGHLGMQEDIRDFKEKAKIMVFNSIFSAGFSSRLMSRVRVKMGLTYRIGGGIDTEILYPGSTSFSTFTKSESTMDAVKAIFDEINIIRKEKVAEKELKDAKDYFLNSFVFRFSSPEQILSNALTSEFYGIAEDFRKNLVESIKAVTAADVLETADKYLQPDKMIVFILGKEEDIRGNLSDLGKVKKIDISIPPPAQEKIPAPTGENLAKGRRIINTLIKGSYRGYKQVKSLEVLADTKMTISGRTLPVGVKSISLYPDKYYNEMSVMGMKVEVIVNGDKGVMRQMGRERPLPQEDIAENRFGDLFFILNTEGSTEYQYLKETEIDGNIYEVIYLFDAKKNWLKLFVNKKTGLIEIEEKMSKLPGISGIAREVKSDFRTVAGIPFAYKSKTYVKGKKVGETTIKRIKVNPPVDASIFHLEKKE